jgi:hypothetical protein
LKINKKNRERIVDVYLGKNLSNNRCLSAFQLEVGPMTFDYHDGSKFSDERLGKIFREHFSAVIAQSVRVSSIIFFGSSNAVRNLPQWLSNQANFKSVEADSEWLWILFLRFGSPSRGIS